MASAPTRTLKTRGQSGVPQRSTKTAQSSKDDGATAQNHALEEVSTPKDEWECMKSGPTKVRAEWSSANYFKLLSFVYDGGKTSVVGRNAHARWQKRPFMPEKWRQNFTLENKIDARKCMYSATQGQQARGQCWKIRMNYCCRAFTLKHSPFNRKGSKRKIQH